MGMDSCQEDSSPTPEKGKNSSWDRTKTVWMDLDTHKMAKFERERERFGCMGLSFSNHRYG